MRRCSCRELLELWSGEALSYRCSAAEEEICSGAEHFTQSEWRRGGLKQACICWLVVNLIVPCTFYLHCSSAPMFRLPVETLTHEPTPFLIDAERCCGRY